MHVTIDGIEYAPVAERAPTPAVGIGITTRNRPDVLAMTLEAVERHTPGAAVVIVDDASDKPVDGASFRFEKNAGIAAAKNKCIELLARAGVEHLFLLDDDCRPTADGWTDLYALHPEPHLMYLFPGDQRTRWLGAGNRVVYDDGTTWAQTHPRGCLLYLDRRALAACGGMRDVWGKWGHEHVEYSIRVNNTGLTTFAFQDACGSSRVIHSMDEHGEVRRTVPAQDRTAAVERNDRLLLDMWATTRGFVEYRERPDTVITALLTARPDPQRALGLALGPADLRAWRGSLRGCRAVILADREDGEDFVRCTASGLSPYHQRWVAAHQWLRGNATGRVWITDGTDVEMLREPWDQMRDGTLYVGYEPAVLDCPWMVVNHPQYAEWIRDNGHLQLLNAGVVGGDHATVAEFVADLVRETLSRPQGGTDMGAFNYVARQDKWAGRLEWGSKVTTVFKADERNGWSWFKHK